jgi:hypothetical protein
MDLANPSSSRLQHSAQSGPEPFSKWLFSQRDGATHSELTDALATVALAVMETGKAGEITLKIRISKASRQGGHQMFIADQITTKAPEPDRDETLFFFDEDSFSLSRRDPRQQELPLQELPRTKPTTLKEI